MKQLTYPLLLLAAIFFSCKNHKPSPFDEGAKWYEVYGSGKLPIISSDSIFIYHLDTNVMKKMTSDNYFETMMEAMVLKDRIRFAYSDTGISYVKYMQEKLTRQDTITESYKLLIVDSIPLLKFGKKILVPWDKNRNYGQADIKKMEDFAPKMELAGYKIGQKIDLDKWVKEGEEMSYNCGCPIGKYKNIHNKDLSCEGYDGYIVELSYHDFSSTEADELKRLYKYYEKDSLETGKSDESFLEKYSNHSDNGTYFSIYKSRDYYIYGYLIDRGKYYSHLSNDTYLEMLATLKHAKEQPSVKNN